MANNDRLTKRVKKIEEWVAENEDMGGPKGYLDTMVLLINQARMSQNYATEAGNKFQQLKAYHDEFLLSKEMGEEWNKFLEEKDNAVQKQQTEEVSVQEQAESSEEVSEAPEEEKK